MSALVLPYKDHTPQIDPQAFIAGNTSIIGEVKIGPRSSVWFGCVLRADVSAIKIGARTNIQDGTVIHESSKPVPTIIGDDVTIGHMALLHACTVEDGAFIGMKACIMDGAVIEKGAMVAAGALVTPGKVVKSGQLYAGAPAKFMRHLEKKDQDHMKWSAAHYVSLASYYMAT
jgi:carbonic anhydrase/acetyltransferase-like protein (isoleucine patch superfamily)